MSIDIAQLAAMLEALEAQKDGTAAPSGAQAEPITRARQFSSLGFVVTGDGPAPSEGQVVQVPVKSGKVVNARVIHRIDTSPYSGEFGEWAFTYKRMKRGETA